MKENYLHENLAWDQSGLPMELDIYLPKERLAFEYQGEGHYQDIYALGHKWKQKQRDEEKKRACDRQGITLIEGPYWWDVQQDSLIATIRRKRSDLLNSKQVGQPIPDHPIANPKTNGIRSVSFLI